MPSRVLSSAKAKRAVIGVAAAASLVGTLASPAQAATTLMPGGKIYAGAVGDTTTIQNATGTTVGVHSYGRLEGSVPQGRMISLDSSATWRTVANAQPGSAIYNNLVRWATTIKARGGTILLAYSHEPELSSKTNMGTAADFKAAYARVTTIFRQQGATNVKHTLQLTDWAFRTSPSDRVYAGNWYPGDAYVDIVGADAYNWYTCGEGRGNWVELSTIIAPLLTFGKAHNKLVALPEFGVTKDSRRAQWLTNAKNYIVSNEAWFAGVYYFNHPPTNLKNADCVWNLSTWAEYSAYGSLLKDVNFAY
ncbi:MAG TPA: glycosyl hydrolase [Intrasporangium sp.]|uniref:glycosyl hydrolase n=1 Tax=Intrasporangium sp. TaxID=1925024 RepID=UPI002D792D7F|nr:glycosyl hydrolase [Intrasporangium sp.]HET7399532.1 glycosyl hydrolase [Intrasporangium sp.]